LGKRLRTARRPARQDLHLLKGAKAAPFPGFLEPCHPTLRPKLPSGAGWQYEIKFDGYRMQLHRHADSVRAFTRNGLDWSREFGSICAAAAGIAAESIVLDGEVVVPGKDGIPDFGAVRGAIGKAQNRLLYYAFDLLHLDGFDLRGVSLADRRRVLEQLLASETSGRIVLSETVDAWPGVDLMHHACELGLEGIVAKRADAPYRGGRQESWIKVRCLKSLLFPVIGYVPAKPNSIAAIRLARREAGGLVYAGKAGTGFTMKSAQNVRARLEPLMRCTPPTAKPLRKRDTVWVEPKLSARIEFRGVTEDGMLRHPSFKGLVTED
jgi:bifunctional non-homologous end joining protein LigD